MKIKIVEPRGLDKRYDSRSLTPTLGPVVVATLLKQQGHDVEVLSEYVSRLNPDDLEEADWVGISITTYNAERGFEIARGLRKPKVFGGYHASLMPEECLEHGDYVIKGDGHSIIQLADYLQGKGKTDPIMIPNLVFQSNGRIIYNQEESRPIHLIPDFKLVKDFHRLNLNALLRIPKIVMGSRGCHHKCSFCCIRTVYPDFVPMNKDLVVENIKMLIRNGHFLAKFFPRIVWIGDDNFFSDPKWAREVLQELAKIRRKDYVLAIQARVDIARNKEFLELLARAGVTRIYLGIESLRQQSLNAFEKKITLEEIENAVEKIRSFGLDVYGLFVFGDDAFQKGDGQRVAEFVERTGITGAIIQPLIPFPGTDLFQSLNAENRILHRRWGEYNGKVVFRPRNLTPAELSDEIYECYRKIFSTIRVLKYFWGGKKGWKREYLGEAIFRYWEGRKMQRYVLENLTAEKWETSLNP
jgi:radical SAM superfamily enzyme YgiQ (UPF0313 family)